MKPNFKNKSDLKVNVQAQTKINQKNIVQDEEQGFSSLDQSLVGQRQFVYFDTNKNPSSINNHIQENISLVGTVQKVYFTNASTMIKEQIQKDKKIYEEINAFKPSQKLTRQQQNQFKKAKSTVPAKNNQTQKHQHGQSIDDNQFLELNHVGKWNKSNKSTIISEEMKKMHTHLENRLTQTKWVKKKPQNVSVQERAQTQKNLSTEKSDSNHMKNNLSTTKTDKHNFTKKQNEFKGLQKNESKAEMSQKFKKQTQKLTEGIAVQNLQKMSSMTSWKQDPLKQEPEEQVDGQQEEQQQEQQEQQQESQSEQQQQQEEESEDEQEEENNDQQNEQGDQQQSSGDEGWDQPEVEDEPENQQEQKQNPFEVAQAPEITQIKAKKWGSTNQNSETLKNPSIQVQNKLQHVTFKQQQNQIEDLTEGQIENDQIDPDWEKIEKILLRIQKLVN